MKYTLSILIWLYNSLILLSMSILFRKAPDRFGNSILVNIFPQSEDDAQLCSKETKGECVSVVRYFAF